MNLNIEDRTGTQQNYDAGRGGQSVVLLVCHKTSGVADLSTLNAVEAKAGVEATIRWLSLPAGHGGGGVSAHYLVGPEVLGAPIYRLVKESDVAWHAGGNPPQFPSTWTDASTGVTYTKYAVNQVSIGVEIWGRINDPIGPNQRLAAIHLVQDIVSRYPVLQKAGHIQAHAALEHDRFDGTDWVALAGATASQYTTTKVPPMPPVPLPPISVTNPKGLGVGGGVLAAMAAHNDTAQSDELYFVPKPNQRTDVTLCSITWGATHMYVSTPNPDGTWRVRTLQEI